MSSMGSGDVQGMFADANGRLCKIYLKTPKLWHSAGAAHR